MTNCMKVLALAGVIALEACQPAAESIPSAQAQPPAGAVTYPQISESAGDSQVHEYH